MSARGMPVLELKAVSRNFGDTEIIRGASLCLYQGERMALIGPNGAGKSTLFNLISGRLAPSAGDIVLHGASIAGLPPHRISRRGLARSFQVSNLFGRLSVYENLRSAVLWPLGYRYAFWHGLGGLNDVRQRAETVLEQIGLQQRRHCLAGELSYAEQRALELGVTIAGGADVILLDEPTAGMSRSEAAAAVELIRRVTAGKTLLLVEHDMKVVFGLADRIALLVQGEVVACDTPAAIRDSEAVRQAYPGATLLMPEAR